MNGDVIAEINYFNNTTDGGPAWLMTSAANGLLVTNWGHEPSRVIIHDLRGKESSVNLDTNALEVLKYEGSVQNEFKKGSEDQQAHYEEIGNIIKKHLGASRVIFYHHIFRNRSISLTVDQCNEHHRNPAFIVHTDVDGPGVRQKIKQLLGGEEAEKLMQHRYEALNVWRPLGPNVITDKPLAICDYCSIDVNSDIHPLEVRASVNTATARTLSQNVHQWYYLSEMRSNEMFVFKMFDSKTDVAECAFHTAFLNKNVPPSNVEQKSLEMRGLVFYD